MGNAFTGFGRNGHWQDCPLSTGYSRGCKGWQEGLNRDLFIVALIGHIFDVEAACARDGCPTFFEEMWQNIGLFYLHEQVNMWVAFTQFVDGFLITDHTAH